MNFPTLTSVNVVTLWTRFAICNGLSRSFIWVNVSPWGTFFAQQIPEFGGTSWVTHYVLVKPSYGLKRLPGLYLKKKKKIKRKFNLIDQKNSSWTWDLCCLSCHLYTSAREGKTSTGYNIATSCSDEQGWLLSAHARKTFYRGPAAGGHRS